MLGTIVVADKSSTVRRMVEIALARHPFELVFAENGDAALEAILDKSPTVAIIDAALPGTDGYELTKQIKSDDATKGVTVILLVGRNSRYDTGRGRTAGVDEHLTKPFLTQKLVERVFTAVGQAVPDADIFRTSLLTIPLANPSKAPPPAAPEPDALLTSAPEPTPPKAAAPAARPAANAAPAASNPMASAKGPFDDNERTSQFTGTEKAPVAEVARAVSTAVVDSGVVQKTLDSEETRKLVERIVWEVVPQLAEAILKEEIAKIVRERMAAS
ncbi:MAG: response regulator [Myxococcales bacterium]|nr:response regulator [Myxococcales bacterium]